MSHPHTRPSDRLRPVHVVLIGIVVMTVAGGSLLLSASDAPVSVDGAIGWHEGSALRSVVELLCLNFSLPTNYAGDIKVFILGLGTCLALLALSIATIVQAPLGVEESRTESSEQTDEAGPPIHQKAHIAPLLAAQILAGLYLLWSFTSSRWSSAPELAVGASVLLAICFLWSFAMGRGLSPAAAKIATQCLMVVGVVTAVIAIWYFYGRNPTLRAKFPFGNPTFLAAALIPAVLVGLSYCVGAFAQAIRSRSSGSIGAGLLSLIGVGVCLVAIYLTGARGAVVGLVFGALATLFFAIRTRRRWIPVAVAGVLVLAGGFFYANQSTESTGGSRVASAQLRGFAWKYAWRMYTEHPLRGHGQAGFVLGGDSYAVEDVLDHPDVLNARIAHVHNEWLEVLANLGSIGIALIGATLLLTLVAGDGVLATCFSGPRKWMHIGLMGALVGLIVEQSLGVGLRTGGLPILFYSVLGLIWSLSRSDAGRPWITLSSSLLRRWVPGMLGIAAAFSCLALSRQDFAAARSGYKANESFFDDDYEETIRVSELATHRLSPQRVLTNLFRLSEAHLRAAEFLQARAQDRQARAHQQSPPSAKLLTLAQEDYRASEAHCEEGSGWLLKLVEQSPGFIHHGRLAQRFSTTRAFNAGITGDSQRQLALMQNAAVSGKRELKRQPFDTSIAADWVGSVLSLPGPAPDLAEIWTVLSRPLRRSRINRSYIDILGTLSTSEEFLRQLDPIVRDAVASLNDDEARALAWTQSWAPEKIRLAATVKFLARDYSGAAKTLRSIASTYDQLASRAAFGAAGFYAELADCTYYADQLDPSSAIEAANKALALAPQSMPGRKLQTSIHSRLVDYYLADGDEAKAAEVLNAVLRLSGPSDQNLQRELGIRYARLGESILSAYQETEQGLTVPQPFRERVQRWASRAVELNPDEPQAHFAAAHLLWRIGLDEASATHLRNALAKGLAVETATEFLAYALDLRQDCKPLQLLKDKIDQAMSRADSKSDQGVPDAKQNPTP